MSTLTKTTVEFDTAAIEQMHEAAEAAVTATEQARTVCGNIGQAVLEIREACRISQANAAEAADIAVSRFQAIERGQTEPTVDELADLTAWMLRAAKGERLAPAIGEPSTEVQPDADGVATLTGDGSGEPLSPAD